MSTRAKKWAFYLIIAGIVNFSFIADGECGCRHKGRRSCTCVDKCRCVTACPVCPAAASVPASNCSSNSPNAPAAISSVVTKTPTIVDVYPNPNWRSNDPPSDQNWAFEVTVAHTLPDDTYNVTLSGPNVAKPAEFSNEQLKHVDLPSRSLKISPGASPHTFRGIIAGASALPTGEFKITVKVVRNGKSITARNPPQTIALNVRPTVPPPPAGGGSQPTPNRPTGTGNQPGARRGGSYVTTKNGLAMRLEVHCPADAEILVNGAKAPPTRATIRYFDLPLAEKDPETVSYHIEAFAMRHNVRVPINPEAGTEAPQAEDEKFLIVTYRMSTAGCNRDLSRPLIFQNASPSKQVESIATIAQRNSP